MRGVLSANTSEVEDLPQSQSQYVKLNEIHTESSRNFFMIDITKTIVEEHIE